MAFYNPRQHRSQAFLYGQDPGMACRTYAGRHVASGLSGPSSREDVRGARDRPSVVAPLQPRLGLCLCCLAASIAPRMATDSRMGRGGHSPGDRARVSVHGSLGGLSGGAGRWRRKDKM